MTSPKKRSALKLKVPVDHQAGQLKAELFEELLSRLAELVFPKAKISRNFIFRRKNSNGIETPTSVDLLVEQDSSPALVIECKVPYTFTPSYGIMGRFYRETRDAIVSAGGIRSSAAPSSSARPVCYANNACEEGRLAPSQSR